MVETSNRVLFQLKCSGTQAAAKIAAQCNISPVSARNHLQVLKTRGLVQFVDTPDGRGRPKRLWTLTVDGHARFPDRHGELAAQLLKQASAVLGDAAVADMLTGREAELQTRQATELQSLRRLPERLSRLAELRSRDGYMASIAVHEQGWMLIQDHCPIRVAVEACPRLCDSELALLQASVGPAVNVERVEHLPDGGRRCVYLIREASAPYLGDEVATPVPDSTGQGVGCGDGMDADSEIACGC